MKIPALFIWLLFAPLLLWAQSIGGDRPIMPPVPADSPVFSDTGDAAIARRYLEWAQRDYDAGRITEAITVLERGADFAAGSSDISYFLALLRSIEGRSRLSVLEACRLALETNRWEYYNAEDARLLEAQSLTQRRRFEEALQVLERCNPQRYEVQYQRLLALRGLAQIHREEREFIRTLDLIMDSFPRETDPVQLLFHFAVQEELRNDLGPAIDLALRRLPILIDTDPQLAYMAVPFMRDRELARRYTASYRAAENPNPASLPAALELGLISGSQAVEELFASDTVPSNPIVLDRDLIVAVNRQLRSEDERALLRRNLLQFTGVITEDRDNDGIVEAWIHYLNGMISAYHHDSAQDGDADTRIFFNQGLPAYAEFTIVQEGADGLFTPLNHEGGRIALLRWERYPALLDAELDGKRYIPRPLDFFFAPVRFISLVFGGPEYPEWEDPFLTERSLLSFSHILEQPSEDFPGETERIELSGGIPLRSTVYIGGHIDGRRVSETEFRNGHPVIQYLDLDMDGRMETRRRFDPNIPYRVISVERDRDGDGIFEYIEIINE